MSPVRCLAGAAAQRPALAPRRLKGSRRWAPCASRQPGMTPVSPSFRRLSQSMQRHRTLLLPWSTTLLLTLSSIPFKPCCRCTLPHSSLAARIAARIPRPPFLLRLLFLPRSPSLWSASASTSTPSALPGLRVPAGLGFHAKGLGWARSSPPNSLGKEFPSCIRMV